MKVLAVVTREMCYMSCTFFLKKMKAELERCGARVDLVDVSSDEADYDILEKYVGAGYDFVLGMNSRLPLLELDNGHLLLDEMGAPLYNYILDHPLFHHAPLMMPIRKGVAIGIDKSHSSYISEYYPHYKYVHTQSMPGTPAARPVKWRDKDIDILFSGTYESPQTQLEEIEKKSPALREIMHAAIAMMKRTGCSMEQAMAVLCEGESDFPLIMNKSYLVDKYMRNYHRERVLTELAAAGLPLTIVGEGWEKSTLADYKNVTVRGGVEFAQSFGMIARSKILLDVNPLFPMGVHDRVPTAFANGTAVCTSQNPMADPDILDGVSAIYYNPSEVQALAGKLSYLLEHEKKAADMAAAGAEIYQQKYTWERFGNILYDWMQTPARWDW